MNKKQLLILIFSTMGTLVAQDLPQLRLVGTPEKSATEFVGSNIVDVNGRICAAIQVLSDLNGFSYDAYNQVVKVDDQPGRDMVYLQPEEQVLEILLSGYQPLKLILRENGIRLASREVWVIKITGDKKLQELSIGIITTPPGAEVFIDGMSRGVGEKHLLATGPHELRLLLPGYQTVTETIQVDEQNTLFRRELKMLQEVNVRIESEPSGAAVFIDGARVGETPVSAFFPQGRYPIRLEKEWYLTKEEMIDIQPPRVRQLYTLAANFGELFVTSSPQSGLDIYVDGVNQNLRTPAVLKPLKPAAYKIKARSADYESDEQEVVMGRGERKELKLTTLAGFATLTIRTVRGAKVTIDGREIMQLENMRMAPAVVVVRAELSKAAPVEQRVVLRKGEVQTVELMPRVPRGAILVSAVPEQARIELSGDAGESYSAVGDKIFDEIPIGTYLLRVALAGYNDHRENIVLKEGERVSRSVKLEKTVAAVQPPAVGKSAPGSGPTGRAAGGVWRDAKTGIEFILIKGGTFEMGDVFNEGDDDERPVHTVTVGDFYLGKTEVTVGQYRAFCQATRRSMPGAPDWGWQEDHPVVNVSWNDAVAYCQWAGYRLPTEAEWEYAARERGGKVRFGNGKNIADPLEINFNSGEQNRKTYSRTGLYRAKTTAVASFALNRLGLYDMSGNAREWCSDWYGEDYYREGPRNEPLGPFSGSERILRGGSWRFSSSFCRVTYRYRDDPGNRVDANGFRVARPAP